MKDISNCNGAVTQVHLASQISAPSILSSIHILPPTDAVTVAALAVCYCFPPPPPPPPPPSFLPSPSRLRRLALALALITSSLQGYH